MMYIIHVYVLHYFYKMHHSYDVSLQKSNIKNYMKFNIHVYVYVMKKE